MLLDVINLYLIIFFMLVSHSKMCTLQKLQYIYDLKSSGMFQYCIKIRYDFNLEFKSKSSDHILMIFVTSLSSD